MIEIKCPTGKPNDVRVFLDGEDITSKLAVKSVTWHAEVNVPCRVSLEVESNMASADVVGRLEELIKNETAP